MVHDPKWAWTVVDSRRLTEETSLSQHLPPVLQPEAKLLAAKFCIKASRALLCLTPCLAEFLKRWDPQVVSKALADAGLTQVLGRYQKSTVEYQKSTVLALC